MRMSKKNVEYPSRGFKDANDFITHLENDDEQKWRERGEEQALALFRAMAERVPAYKDFLKKNNISVEKIETIEDFKQVPTVDKNNYLRSYPLPDLSWDGKLAEEQLIISTTSGSTGEPFYFPRTREQDLQYALLAEGYLRTNFKIHERRTLYINGFPMGAWIGGVFTYSAVREIAERRKYPLSIISPGVHKLEILKAVQTLGPYFDQVLIGSYGPFLKDIIDDGTALGIDWKRYNLGFIFSAEGFTEGFRDYVLEKGGVQDTYRGSLNHYGTVDLGTMSYETPLAVLARREALSKKDIYQGLFGDTIQLPTFTQYVPELFYFESNEGNLICSGASGLPLVRYDLKDRGGILPFEQGVRIFSENGVELLARAKEVGISDTVWKLPFVYVYERSDFSVSFYAFQIYPETIRRALQASGLNGLVTGKFTMLVDFDENQNQYLQLHVELKGGQKSDVSVAEKVREGIHKKLLEESSEYRETYNVKKEKVLPRVTLWAYEDPTHFRPGIKQKWVKK